MSANGNRLNTLDVNTITNSDPSVEAVSIGKGLRGKEYFPKLNDFDYVQLADISGSGSGAAKTTLDSDGTPKVIDWFGSEDPDGDGTQTYYDRHGDGIPIVTASYFDSGLSRNRVYSPTISFDLNVDGQITNLYLDDLFEGLITII